MYIILVNDGVYECRMFDRLGEVRSVIDKWSNGERMEDEEGDEVTMDRLIKIGECGEKIDVYCESMVEMGDDYVSLSIVELY